MLRRTLGQSGTCTAIMDSGPVWYLHGYHWLWASLVLARLSLTLGKSATCMAITDSGPDHDGVIEVRTGSMILCNQSDFIGAKYCTSGL